MMKKTQLVSAIGAVAGLSFAAGVLAMDSSNPFQAEDLDLGAAKLGLDGHKEGSCGEGSCGEGNDKDKEGSCGEA